MQRLRLVLSPAALALAAAAVLAATGVGAAPAAAAPAPVHAAPTASGRLAFTFQNQVWTVAPDGSGRRKLTSDGKNYHATWSADGTRLAYVHEPFAGVQDIWIMRADGSGKRQVTRNHPAPGGATWSPDGTRLALVSGDFAYTASVVTGALTEMTGCTPDDAEQGYNRPLGARCRPTDQIEALTGLGTPAWSPDGRYIALTSGGGIYDTIVNLWAGNDRSVYIVAADGGYGSYGLYGSDPSWYPGTTSFAISHQDVGASTAPYAPPTVRTIAVPLPGDTAVPVPQVLHDSEPAFSPDGKRLAVMNNAHGAAIFVIRLSDGSRHQLVPGMWPAWQPAG